MPGDDDDYEYTTTDVSPRQPDKFEKSDKPDNRESDERRDDGRELRESK